MTFPLSPFSGPGQLQAPGQLFTPQRSTTPAPQINPAPPAMPADRSGFSRVSQLLGIQPILNGLPPLRELPSRVLNGLERGWQSLKDTFTFQFEEKGKTGTAREAEANCGPASATMILKQFGIPAPPMQELRRMVGAPVGTRGSVFALTTTQVGEAVRKTAAARGVKLSYDVDRLSTNVDQTLAAMKKRLDAGEKVILLTSNINSLSRGHYVVVKEVRPNGSIVVDDPALSNGENKVHTKAQLAKALSMRTSRYGLESSMISFKR